MIVIVPEISGYRPFAQKCLQAYIRETSNLRITGPLLEDFNRDRWILS